jgi:hypothetical protein
MSLETFYEKMDDFLAREEGASQPIRRRLNDSATKKARLPVQVSEQNSMYDSANDRVDNTEYDSE